MTMRYKLLGRSGLRVSELCLGTMTFGDDWGWGAPPEESRRIFEVFAARGGNFIDTANVYTNGSSEKIVGELVRAERARFVVATKYALATRADDPNAHGSHRKNLAQSLEASLRRLNTDYIDVYWVHAWDWRTPVDEVMRALDDAVRAGKILYLGVSDTPAWTVAQANTLAELRGWSRFVGLQVEYSLIERTVEREHLPMARALGLGVTAWGPLGGGVLSGKYGRASGEPPASDSRRATFNQFRLSEHNLAIVDELRRVAEELGRTPSQVALRWLRDQAGVVIPVIGARTVAQMNDNLAALEVDLSEAQRQRLDEVSRIELGFPHDFLAMPQIRQALHGKTGDLID